MTSREPMTASPSPSALGLAQFFDKLKGVFARRFPRCRDCADENGTCPQSGLPCEWPDVSGALIATAKELEEAKADQVLAQERYIRLHDRWFNAERRAEEAEAMVAVLTEAARKASQTLEKVQSTLSGYLDSHYDALLAECSEAEALTIGAIFALTPRAQALLSDMARLREGQRTPGMIEVCSLCRRTNYAGCRGYRATFGSELEACPLKSPVPEVNPSHSKRAGG